MSSNMFSFKQDACFNESLFSLDFFIVLLGRGVQKPLSLLPQAKTL